MAAAIFVDSHSMTLEQNNNILTETYINHEARASRFKSAIKPKSEKYSERTFTYQILDQKAESFISKLPVELLNLDSKELDDLYFLGLKKISHLLQQLIIIYLIEQLYQIPNFLILILFHPHTNLYSSPHD